MSQSQTHFLALASLHRTIVRLRSRIDWLSERDANTEYFHLHARYCKRKNYIAKLQVDDSTLWSQEVKEEAVWQFYNGHLGTHQSRESTLNVEAFFKQPQDLAALDTPISESKVWDVKKSLPSDKAPGPDGFMGRFYKACWPTIKQDVMVAIGVVHGGDSKKLHMLNSDFMILIPKKEDTIKVGDF